MKSLQIIFATIAITLSFSAFAANRPTGYVTICTEGKTCSVSTTTTVAFGRADKFFYKVLSGSFSCTAATFGGRVAGGTNECSVPKKGSSSSSSSSSASFQAPAGTTFCASPGETCSFTGTRKVTLWACDTSSWVCSGTTASFTNPILCDMSSYGGGTISGKLLGCWVGSDISSQPPLPSGTPPASITGASCISTGNVIVTSSIIVPAGTTYDGACKTYVGNGLDNGESPQSLFRIEAGGTLKNVIIGTSYTGGVHVYGGGTLDNVSWLDVSDTGITVKSSGTLTVRNITATKGNDRFLQINAASTVNVTNCILDEITQTVVRQNGGTTFKTDVTFDSCRIAGPTVSIFRTDSTVSTAQLLNSYVRMSGRICYGSWASCTYTNSFSY